MNKSIIQRLVSLASDSKFIELENSINEPNIFKIIGRTHLERAHSCFWGWLLDPNGSHGLNEYVIQQILLLDQVVGKQILQLCKLYFQSC